MKARPGEKIFNLLFLFRNWCFALFNEQKVIIFRYKSLENINIFCLNLATLFRANNYGQRRAENGQIFQRNG